jgi:hypothetical protein
LVFKEIDQIATGKKKLTDKKKYMDDAGKRLGTEANSASRH